MSDVLMRTLKSKRALGVGILLLVAFSAGGWLRWDYVRRPMFRNSYVAPEFSPLPIPVWIRPSILTDLDGDVTILDRHLNLLVIFRKVPKDEWVTLLDSTPERAQFQWSKPGSKAYLDICARRNECLLVYSPTEYAAFAIKPGAAERVYDKVDADRGVFRSLQVSPEFRDQLKTFAKRFP
jgi:hypothetical protein